jgi:hypothetical protein
VSSRRLRILRSGIGQDVRAWPMLALLAATALLAIGCVLWFMREAMRNERVAAREKLVEAYRGQLALFRAAALERWSRWLEQIDSPEPDPAHFARCAEQQLAAAVICFGPQGEVIYPGGATPADSTMAAAAGALQNELRDLRKADRLSELVQLVEKRFGNAEAAPLADAQGRQVAASAELMALESMSDPADPVFVRIGDRLAARVVDYDVPMPSAQRRFIIWRRLRLRPPVRSSLQHL